ncbi:hypothetical protein [Nesterenkonia suensis]
MSDQDSTVAWGVSVTDVVAVASQADVFLSVEGGAVVSNDVFEAGEQPNMSRRVSLENVAGWIERVGAVVSTRLHRRSRLSPTARDEFETAMGTVVEVGAAAYLVDAAYPQRAGVNDQGSYGHVLWTRYRQGLDDLEEALSSRLNDGDEGETPDVAGDHAAAAFPPVVFTDTWVRDNTDHLRHRPRSAGRAPGAESPGGW